MIAANKYQFLSFGYYFKIFLVIALVISALKIHGTIDQQLTMKGFDPYQILEIEQGADVKTITKAYR